MFGRIGAFGAQLATTAVFLTHIAVEKVTDAGLAPPPFLLGAAVAVCGTSYVVKKFHRKNLHNRNNRRSSKQKVPCGTPAAFLASYREAAGSVEHLLFCRLSRRGLTRHLTTSLLS